VQLAEQKGVHWALSKVGRLALRRVDLRAHQRAQQRAGH
jgi:hypothetical protein